MERSHRSLSPLDASDLCLTAICYGYLRRKRKSCVPQEDDEIFDVVDDRTGFTTGAEAYFLDLVCQSFCQTPCELGQTTFRRSVPVPFDRRGTSILPQSKIYSASARRISSRHGSASLCKSGSFWDFHPNFALERTGLTITSIAVRACSKRVYPITRTITRYRFIAVSY